MTDKLEIIKESIDKAAPIRETINNDLYEQYRGAISSFKETSHIQNLVYLTKKGEHKKSANVIIKSLIDSLHYLGGGYPSENTLGRLEQRLAYIGPTLYLAKKLGIDNFDETLKSFGFKNIEIDEEYFDSRLNMNTDNVEVLKGLIFECEQLQTDICKAADEIKIDIFDELDEEVKYDSKKNPTGIKKGNFLKLVSAKVKKDPERAKQRIIDNIENDITNKEEFEFVVNKTL